MIGRLIKDESGMTMGLVVIMVVLIGVMGAGLLTFVQRDLTAVVEVNRGQQALEVADAGIQAAKQQLISDTFARAHYDGGGDDLPWSYCYRISGCTTASPTSTGSAGMRINMDSGNYANVTILMTSYSPAGYTVISEGRVGETRRKIEATFRSDPDVGTPPAFFTRGGLTLTGNANANGISLFALGNIKMEGGSASLGTSPDEYFGKWAATSGDGPYPNALGSYPNAYNAIPRADALAGLGTPGTITTTGGAQAFKNTRSYDSTTNPKMVLDYNADGTAGQQAGEMGFPFRVKTPTEDRQDIDALRDRALELERANPSTNCSITPCYYIDRNPGDGVADAGMDPRTTECNSPLMISSWPADSTYETVRFYKFQTYSANNCVYYAVASDCTTTTNKGVIVVENGDMIFEGNRRFDGAIVVRAYDSSGAFMGDSAGKLTGSGNPCLYGYANTSGHMKITGSIKPGSAPELGGLGSFRGSMEQVSWRELYQ